MIKVTLNEQPKEENEYPKLMIHNDGCIMLFVKPSEGVCIVAGGSTPVGHITNCMSMVNFRYYHEPITLQNA